MTDRFVLHRLLVLFIVAIGTLALIIVLDHRIDRLEALHVEELRDD